MAQIYSAPVIGKRILAEDTVVLEFELPELAQLAQPGHFVMVGPMRDQVNFDPITPRPYSILGLLYDESDTPYGFSLIIKTFGRGSEAICARQVGDHLRINGPLGRPLSIAEHLHFVMVAGGTGVAPVTFAAQQMTRNKQPHTVLYGGRNKDAVFLKELERYGASAVPATEDGSLGHHGFVTELLEMRLDSGKDGQHVFSCGPWGMMRASVEVARRFSVPCTCSLERYMACGFGVCLACIYKKTTDEVNHTCCKEGPVVDGMEVDWDA